MNETRIVKGQSGKEYTCRRIIAQYPGTCGHCGGELKGTEMWYAKGLRPFHVQCPPKTNGAPIASSQVAQREQSIRTNRQSQPCWICGHMVPAGQGELFYADPEDESMYGFQSGWLVGHLDKNLCNANIKANKEADETARAREATRKAERAALVESTKKETGLEEHGDWSWDDYRFDVGEEIASSEHFVARKYFCDKDLIGFVIKEKGK